MEQKISFHANFDENNEVTIRAEVSEEQNSVKSNETDFPEFTSENLAENSVKSKQNNFPEFISEEFNLKNSVKSPLKNNLTENIRVIFETANCRVISKIKSENLPNIAKYCKSKNSVKLNETDIPESITEKLTENSAKSNENDISDKFNLNNSVKKLSTNNTILTIAKPIAKKSTKNVEIEELTENSAKIDNVKRFEERIYSRIITEY